jgi:hypothetical protein
MKKRLNGAADLAVGDIPSALCMNFHPLRNKFSPKQSCERHNLEIDVTFRIYYVVRIRLTQYVPSGGSAEYVGTSVWQAQNHVDKKVVQEL